MGSVFGKVDAKEPPFQKLKSEPYEVRIYAPSVVAEVDYDESSNDAFNCLAKFIGVTGTPENLKGTPAIAETSESTKVATHEKIAMTAPVLTQNNYMQFILPQKYERVDQVPTPTNPSVIIKEAPQRIVAVYKFSGACTREQCTKKLKKLHKMLVADQLLEGPAAASLAAQPPAGGFSASSAADTAAAASAQAEFTGKMEQPASEPPAQAEELSATAGAKGPAQEEPAQQKEKAEKGEREEDLSGFVADALSWLVAQYHPPWTLPFLRRNEVWIELDPQIPAVVTLLQQYQQYQQAQQEQDAEGQVESGMKGGAAEVGAGAEAVGGDVLQSGSSGAAQEEGTSAAAGGAGMQYTPSLGTQQPIVESSGKYQQQQNVGFTTPPAGPETDSD